MGGGAKGKKGERLGRFNRYERNAQLCKYVCMCMCMCSRQGGGETQDMTEQATSTVDWIKTCRGWGGEGSKGCLFKSSDLIHSPSSSFLSSFANQQPQPRPTLTPPPPVHTETFRTNNNTLKSHKYFTLLTKNFPRKKLVVQKKKKCIIVGSYNYSSNLGVRAFFLFFCFLLNFFLLF